MRPSVHGALVVNKPPGVTSHDVVARVRKIYGTRAVGHAGTLDPIATGLLVCLLGEATKLSQYVMGEDKSYRVGIKFGVRTDSGDISGKIIEEKPFSGFEKSAVENQIKMLTGDVQLSVPLYSAIKVDGKKLYEYAREKEEVEIPVKTMTINAARLVEVDSRGALVELDCEKGTYVRSWVERLGELLGCGATVESLCRTRSGAFDLSSALDLDTLDKSDDDFKKRSLVPLAEILGAWPALKVLGRDLALLKNGQIPKSIFSQVLASSVTHKGIRLLSEQGGLVALVLKDPSKGLKLARVFSA